jgi:glycerol-3-phosphate O-acyltransferase
MRYYCEQHSLDFKHLEKDQRIPKVIELANHLMDELRFVMPIIPVPILCAVLLNAKEKSLTSLEIFSACDELIDSMIAKGAAMKPDEKPRHRTLSNSLEMLNQRGLLVETNDHYLINQSQKGLVEYYANSIEHWWRASS